MKKFWLLNHLEICHLGWWLMLMYKDCQPERQDRERQRERQRETEADRQTDRGRERERERETERKVSLTTENKRIQSWKRDRAKIIGLKK